MTVVIPALNEAAILERCLTALTSCVDPAEEILVVDNGSTDGTAEIAARVGSVRVLREERGGITYARTTGFDGARGDIIARIDADTLVSRNWVNTIRDTFVARPDVDAIAGGAAIAELSPGHCFWFRWWYRGFRAWHQRSIGIFPMMYGFNGAMRREAWEKCRSLVAMGDECVSEDVDVTISLLRTGHRLVFVPRLVVKARLFRSIDKEKLGRYYRTDGMTLARHRFGKQSRWIEDAALRVVEVDDAR